MFGLSVGEWKLGRLISLLCSLLTLQTTIISTLAGGLVTLGIEGAVIGPLTLCFLTIVVESYKMAIQSRFLDTAATTASDANGHAPPTRIVINPAL